jgi:hypothetical protein
MSVAGYRNDKIVARCFQILAAKSLRYLAISILHAMLHSGKITQAGTWSFEDVILNDMVEDQIRRIPRHCDHSIVWILWHIARIEDLTINLLVSEHKR